MSSSDISFSEPPRDKSLEWSSGGKTEHIRIYFNSTDAICWAKSFLKMKTRRENPRPCGVWGAFSFQNTRVKWPV